MWRPLQANLLYQWRTAMYGLFVVIVVATALNVILPAVGAQPDADDDFKLFFLYPIFVTFFGLFWAFNDFVVQRKESRLMLHALLPRTRWQIGLARMLSPILLLLACLFLSLVLMFLLQLAAGIDLAGWRFYFLAYFAGFFMIVLQGPVMIEELKPAFKRSRLLRLVFAGLIVVGVGAMVLRSLGRHIGLLPEISAVLRPDFALDPEPLSSSLILHSIGWVMVGINTWLFSRRRTVFGA